MKYVILVDVQKGFVIGNLGTPEAVKAVNFIKNYLKNMDKENTALIFTQDTHHKDTYMNTMEGKKLPIPHCLLGTEDWEIVDSLDNIAEEGFFVPNVAPFCNERGRVFKETFGSIDLINLLYHLNDCGGPVEEIIIMGLVTNMCVLVNTLLIKSAFPNTPIKIVSQGCAGTSKEAHEQALKILEGCHIDIVR